MAAPKTPRPFGAWPSPVTAELVLSKAVGLPAVRVNKLTKELLWVESRPSEAGRQALVSRTVNGDVAEVIPDQAFNARSRAHEYGGGESTWAGEGRVVFSDVKGAIYEVARDGEGGGWGKPRQITEDSDVLRFADFAPHPTDPSLIALVVEDHSNDTPSTVVNTLQLLNTATKQLHPLRSGSDFYSSPRFSPSGRHLAWIEWNHPDMPWEGSELWVAELGKPKDGQLDLVKARKIAGEGNGKEAVSQPRWSLDGDDVVFASDRTGWLELYECAVDGDGVVKRLSHEQVPQDEDVTPPDWAFGNLSHEALSGTAWVSIAKGGKIRIIDLTSRFSYTIPTPYVDISSLVVVDSDTVAVIASPAAKPTVLALLTINFNKRAVSEQIVQRSSTAEVDAAFISTGQAITFPTKAAPGEKPLQVAHAVYYPPASRDSVGLEGELPPLVTRCHGGPSSSAGQGLDWNVAWFTSRGFAFVDVNYGGSTGFGKAFRQRLHGQWGVVDVDDTIAAVEHLVRQGKADGKRVAIAGGSAGGFTVLAALAAGDVFGAGVSRYGISDLFLLAEDTHKFESRYMEGLVGGTPESDPELYRERSPINHCDRIKAPMLLQQGTEDKVVPPEQAKVMADKIKAGGGQVEVEMYEGEGHGFRRAESRKRAMESELKFYWKTFGIEGGEL